MVMLSNSIGQNAVEHVFGRAARVAAFEARVVLDADPGEQRDLLTS
ncbi:MAG: hypothetical protein R2698_15055 [Microthrixaceae bacterium]